MLPKVVVARKIAAQDASAKLQQTTVDLHLEEKPEVKHNVTYSDAIFREAAIKWLVSTDQVSFIFSFTFFLMLDAHRSCIYFSQSML